MERFSEYALHFKLRHIILHLVPFEHLKELLIKFTIEMRGTTICHCLQEKHL